MDINLLYVTFPNREAAVQVARELIKEGLAACMNLYRMDSLYAWDGEIVEGEEYAAIFKTDQDHLATLRMAIERWHPYEVPCILSWSARANTPYSEWIQSCLTTINSSRPSDGPEATP